MIVSEQPPQMASVPLGATSPAQITEFSAGTGRPYQAVLGPDGAIWFAEITTATRLGASQPTARCSNSRCRRLERIVTGVTTGPDGAIWFTEDEQAKIGKIQ